MMTAWLRHFSLIFSAVFLWTASISAGSPPPVGAAGGIPDDTTVMERVEIRIDGAVSDSDRAWMQHAAENLIEIKPGTRLTPEALHVSISLLKQSRMFEQVDVETTPAGNDRAVLRFSLKPYARVGGIRITGNRPLFESQVRRAMTLQTGDPLEETVFSRQKSLIEDLYRQEGFPAPEVRIVRTSEKNRLAQALQVKIRTGNCRRLGRVEFVGVRVFSESALAARMKIRQRSLMPGCAGRYRKSDMDGDMEEIISRYREKGYLDVGIRTDVTTDPHGGLVNLTLTVTEGPGYQIAFSGHHHFSSRELKEEAALQTMPPDIDEGIRQRVENLRKKYEDAGFLQVHVDGRRVAGAHGAHEAERILFAIDEGPRTLVKRVEIRGAKAFPEKVLRGYVLTRPPECFHDGAYSPRRLMEDAAAIRAHYLGEGYCQADVRPDVSLDSNGTSARIVIEIQEGPRTLVKSVAVKGVEALGIQIPPDTLRLHPGAPFRRFMAQSDRNALAMLVSETGRPHVQVSAEVTMDQEGQTASIVYHVTPGPAVQMGEVWFTGHARTREALLRREADLKTGNPFSLEKVTAAQRRLRNLEALERSTFQLLGMREQRGRVHLLAQVVEKPSYLFQSEVGYRSDNGLNGRMYLADRNFRGADQRVWVAGEINQTGYRLAAGTGIPRFFEWPPSADFTVYYEDRQDFNQDFGVVQYGMDGGLWWKIPPVWALGLGGRFFRKDSYHADVFPLDDEGEARTITALIPHIQYDTRDSATRPREGLLVDASVEISKGFRGTRDDFLKYRLEAGWFYPLFSPLTLAFAGRAGYIDPYGSNNELRDDQLFYLGGIADVRGFEENLLRRDAADDPVGGRISLSGTVEARISLTAVWELALFWDTGRISDTIGGQGRAGFRNTLGTGLRYITPIGPIGLMYGHKLDRKTGESAGAWHFSIGYTF